MANNQLVPMANNHLPTEELTHDRIQETLDSLENGVDRMRELARVVSENKESILNSLGSLLNSPVLKETKGAEREEIELRLDNLVKRCLGVEIDVQTIRNPNQELAFERIIQLIQTLLESANNDLKRSREVTERYFNSCLAEPKGPIDEGFQATLLECTAEDQKDVRKRLELYLKKMEAAHNILQTCEPVTR